MKLSFVRLAAIAGVSALVLAGCAEPPATEPTPGQDTPVEATEAPADPGDETTDETTDEIEALRRELSEENDAEKDRPLIGAPGTLSGTWQDDDGSHTAVFVVVS